MNARTLRSARRAAEAAARAAGALMRRNLHAAKRVNLATQHDIKLELDVRCQRLIERALRQALPEAGFLGEEEGAADCADDLRWVVDPIDGTVNFAYGVPHACVSIALQRRVKPGRRPDAAAYEDGFETLLGVVNEPFTDELWAADIHGPARLNGRVIRVYPRRRLDESMIAMGFAKSGPSLDRMLPVFNELVHRVRKLRIMGAAALSLIYVAAGRFDAYVEFGVRLWDIAAAGLILQRAGGTFWRREIPGHRTYEIRVSAPTLQRTLQRIHRSVGQ